jgi:hypothetical protein
MATDSTWEQRLVEIWTSIDHRPAAEFVAAVDQHTAELSADDGVGFFERAAARDSTGSSDLAVPLYRQALDRGLIGERRRRAVIQLASSLRNLGAATESVALLRAEQGQPSDSLDDAVEAFLALALADIGQAREALSIVLSTLAPHLPRYQRSVGNYARLLLEG